MKTAASVIVLVVMPLGFFFLAAIIVNRMLAKRRQRRPDRGYEASALPDAPDPAQSLVIRSRVGVRSLTPLANWFLTPVPVARHLAGPLKNAGHSLLGCDQPHSPALPSRPRVFG